jgi:hypothetical protein
MGTAVGFAVLFDVCVMPNVPAAAETVIDCDADEPAAVAVTVAVPALAAVPAVTIENLPCASVTPDVGDIVSCPPVFVAQVAVYATPGKPVPTAFFAINVTVTGDVPSLGTLVPDVENTESVEPEIWIGICALAPAVAVMVAVRLAKLDVPDLKVNVTVPSAPVVTVGALTIPVSVDNPTTIPESAAFDASNAVTVIVVDAELSEGIVVDVAVS